MPNFKPDEEQDPGSKKIKELKKRMQLDFKQDISTKNWVRIAYKKAQEADYAYVAENYEEAYMKYFMVLDIMLNHVPKQPDYHTLLNFKDPVIDDMIKNKKKYMEFAENSRDRVKEQEAQKARLKSESVAAVANGVPQLPVRSSSISKSTNYPPPPPPNRLFDPTKKIIESDNNSFKAQRFGLLNFPLPPNHSTSKLDDDYEVKGIKKTIEFNLIAPEQLISKLNASNLTNSPTILFLDVRESYKFVAEHINFRHIVNVEPLMLRSDTNPNMLEKVLMLSNSSHKLFLSRQYYDMVILVDQNSENAFPTGLNDQPSTSPHYLYFLIQLLCLDKAKILKHKPFLLKGGVDAWKSYAGEKGVTPNRNIVASPEQLSSANSPNRMHQVIGKSAGREFNRSIFDFFQSSHENDGNEKQSMIQAPKRATFPEPNHYYGPSLAQPQTNSNAANPYDSTSSASTQVTSHTKLQRRLTQFDNPYYGFTPTRKEMQSYWDEVQAPKDNISNDVYLSPPLPARDSSPQPPGLKMPEPMPILQPIKAPDLPQRPPLPPLPNRQGNGPPPLPPKPNVGKEVQIAQIPTVSSLSHAMNIGTTGLRNLGNTCYMNSIVQCISGTIPLTRYFLDGSYKRHINQTNPLGYKGQLVESFVELIRSLWMGNTSYISPVPFKNVVGKFNSDFKGSDQQDSQEYLAFLLDGLHEDLNLVQTRPQLKDLDEDAFELLPEAEQSNIAWERYLSRNNSIIVSLFQGQLKSQLRCTYCNKTSTTYNAFMYLSLPIPKSKTKQPVNLLQCLDEFVKEEVLDGDDAWNCSRCKIPRKSIKRLTISRLPDVLLIHLKRFSFEGPFSNKLDQHINLPLQGLNLSNYVPPTAPKSSVLSPRGVPLGNKYDLYAVSNHFGTLTGGHYTASVRSGYGGKWHYFDDSRVTVIQEKEVVTKAAYNLFYVRTNSETAHL